MSNNSISKGVIQNCNFPPDSQEYRVRIAFKSQPDTVSLSNKKEKNKTILSLGALALIGVGAVVYFLTRGKSGSKPVQEAVENSGFKNINEAKEYFENLGIKTVFKDGTEKHLADLDSIKRDLTTLKTNGAEISKPDTIVFADWSKKTELEEILRDLNLSEDAIRDIPQTLSSNSGMWGTVDSIKGGGNIVFINNNFSSNANKFIHEMGHLNQDLETSFWHSKGLKGEKFRQKQYEILGLEPPKNLASPNTYRNWSNQSLDDLFRTSCNGGCHTSNDFLKEKICNLFPELNGNFETVFFAPVQKSDGSIDAYYINAKKMLEKMHSESKVYAPNKTFENVAEIFEGLNQGKTYSDEVMLMYDFCGGGRLPNLKIKGKSYDDYIESLYQNQELIEKFKTFLEIKKLV